DTLPYNAHTTAGDALWADLPILTRIGETFAGRVAAALLHDLGLPELGADSPQAYEAPAIDLACHPAPLVALPYRLEQPRATAAPFDTGLQARRLEAAYQAMHQRRQAGLPPSPIDIAA